MDECPIIEEQIPIESNPVRIELDDSLLDRFNELSEDELKESFGTFTPTQSLNPYMTKLSMCSIEQAWLALFIFNSQVSKKFTPQVSSWFSSTKGIDCEEMTHDQADPTISGYSS